MKLHVRFDDELIRRDTAQGRNPVFVIYWTYEGAAYPEEQWLDFGSVVIGWWLVAAKLLLDGSNEADLPFMDGPFCLQARLVGNVISVTSEDQSWQGRVPAEVFVTEILGAADEVQQKLKHRGISDRQDLQTGIRQLKIAASEASKSLNTRGVVVQYT